MDPKEIEPLVKLRRLEVAVANAPPDDEEARKAVAELGIDMDALYARILAKADAHAAAARRRRPPKSFR
jgi:hypothetical protein